MTIIPKECIGFHKHWLKGGNQEEKMEDLDTMDVIRSLISLHYEITNENDNLDNFLMILDRLNENNRKNSSNQLLITHRNQQIQLAKQLVSDGNITIVDAIFLLFSRQELFG